MKAIISTTYSDTYFYFLPIVTFCWNKLGVDVICFMPSVSNKVNSGDKTLLVYKTMYEVLNSNIDICTFNAQFHKQSTYAQCSRLYGACLDLPEDEILITGDVDMAMFKVPEYTSGSFNVFGSDLTPPKQFPICYLMATVKEWRMAFNLQYGCMSERLNEEAWIETRKYQECLDSLLGGIEAESFRGNYWSKDQEEAYNKISKVTRLEKARAREGTQFATKRVDRDDLHYMDRLDKDIIDAHLWRPGYTEENFPKILELLQYFYPEDDFNWLIEYTNEYRKLVG